MSNRLRAKVTLEEGEAYAVLPLERWEHVITTYRTLAERLDTTEGKEAWLELAAELEEWVFETLNLGDDEEPEDEWS